MSIKLNSFSLKALFLGLALAAFFIALSFYWFDIVQIVAHWQQHYSGKITQLLKDIDQNPIYSGSILIGIALLYGVIHAIGPGHGKVIIATYIATHPQKLKKSLLLTLCGSLLQGASAILMVSCIILILQLSRHYLNVTGFWLEKISALFVIVIGLLFIVKATRSYFNGKKKKSAFQIQALKTIASSQKFSFVTAAKQLHYHHVDCGCGHKHTLEAQELDQKGWSLFLIILSMGLRPCTGALSLLMFAYLLGLYAWGVLAVFMMSIGTALTIAVFAFLIHVARQSLLKLYSNRHFQSRFSNITLLVGGLLLIVLGVILYQSLDMAQLQSGLMPKTRFGK